MRTPLALSSVLALAALALAGCKSGETHEPLERPVRFAVLAAPELGQDDGDILSAVTKLSREKELAFVLVLGPLFATDADATSVDLFKNDMGQVAAPVYVAFSSSAPVTSGAESAKGKLTAEEILAALETMGPGPGHKVSYVARPERARQVAIAALAPDGTGAPDAMPEGASRLLVFGTSSGIATAPYKLRPDMIVGVAPGKDLVLTGSHPDDPSLKDEPVVLRVPVLSTKQFAVVTLGAFDVEVVPVAIEGKSDARSESVVLPHSSRPKPPG